MPAVSEDQRRAACMALSAKQRLTPVSKLKGAAKSMYESMSEEQLKDYCKGEVEE